MRESKANLEQLIVVMDTEHQEDIEFVKSLLEHKNATISWVRERHDYELAQIDGDVERINQQYNSLVEALEKEIKALEGHLTAKG